MGNPTLSKTSGLTFWVAPPTSTVPCVDARGFSPDGPHAGTLADPWPGVAIKNAIDSLNDATGTVCVANGYWNVDSALSINRRNWTLQGGQYQRHPTAYGNWPVGVWRFRYFGCELHVQNANPGRKRP